MASGVVGSLQELLGRPKEPAGHITAKDNMRPAGGTDAAARNVVAPSRAGASCRPVQGVGELSAQVSLRPDGPEVLEFAGGQPS